MLNDFYSLSKAKKSMILFSLFVFISILVILSGGTKHNFIHFFYISIFFASKLYEINGGAVGGIITGIAIAIIPFDSIGNDIQSIDELIARIIIFISSGVITGKCLAHALKKVVVAEGVENKRTL